MIASNWKYDFNMITSNLVLSELCNNRLSSDKQIWNIQVSSFFAINWDNFDP